ncbi:GerW family sporulation protein [Oceanobacillus halophilus]|uniref:Sporulation protein YtfJ n=1 Tax=Oceanobacillus halophilus TaxID=930130 RepID=A0A494ZX17_9BACI|nr:GerW family sporulation protein [Oceanobacillus halophilus]RKQ30554.1 sporulation protein YtfJ [Oceanobacillus halophilus]
MEEHPIQGLMTTAMENLSDMIEVNTIVGDPVESPDGSIIIPVSKLGFGFAAGGSEFSPSEGGDSESQLPFGGGSGGGVSITPIAFLVLGKDGIKMVHLDQQTHLYEKMLNQAPQVVKKIQEMLKDSGVSLQKGNDKKEEKTKKDSEDEKKESEESDEKKKSQKDNSINYDI